MKISILQPHIHRGNVSYNAGEIQKLMDRCSGDIMILAEYALTGSLVLDETADIKAWEEETSRALTLLRIPDGKKLLINRLIRMDENIYNACTLLPTGESRMKCYPDQKELEAGICPGGIHSLLHLGDKKVAVIICSDLREINHIPTDGADCILFIFHFTKSSYDKVMHDVISISRERQLPVVIASLSSDMNIGHSCYINASTIVSLGDGEGILEITI